MYTYYMRRLLEEKSECLSSTEFRGCKHSPTWINILLNIVNDSTADLILLGRGLNSHWLHRRVCNNSVSNPSFTSSVDKMEGLQVLLRPVPLKTNTSLNVMFWSPEGNSRRVLPSIVQSTWPVRLGSSAFSLSTFFIVTLETSVQHNRILVRKNYTQMHSFNQRTASVQNIVN